MTLIIVPLSKYVNSRIKGLWNLTKIGRKSCVGFSSEDEVGDNIIALDIRKRKLFYLKKTPGTSSCLIIDLNNLVTCSIKKQYNSINAGDLNTRKLQDFLKSIFLQLCFKNGSGTVALPLYEAQKDSQVDIEQLEAKAKKWETIVSKLLPMQIRERA